MSMARLLLASVKTVGLNSIGQLGLVITGLGGLVGGNACFSPNVGLLNRIVVSTG